MDTQIQGTVTYEKWYWVRTLQYRIKVETTDTHWRKTGQPASGPQPGDQVVKTYFEFIKFEEKMGVDHLHPADWVFSFLMDNLIGVIINKLRQKEPYENVGLLEHPNHLLEQ